MLKRLFIVIFILQSFATSALAGMNVSQLNQAEKTQMQIMHHTMDMSSAMASSMSIQNMPTSFNTQEALIASPLPMDCPDCDQGALCDELVCNSIHTSSPFYAPLDKLAISISVIHHFTAGLVVNIQDNRAQPETPPPSI